jgi:signal transduction histidine kinase
LSADLERFFELTPDICCVMTLDGTIEASTSCDLVGQRFAAHVHPEDRARVEIELARPIRSSFTARWRSGDDSYREVRWLSLVSPPDRRLYVLGRDEPVTLGRSERLMSLGQVALGVVHDLKNVLVHPLGLQLQRVERAIAANALDRARLAIDAMRDIVHDGLEAIDRMLQFARPTQRPVLARADVEGITWRATEIARAYARSITPGTEIQIAYTPGKPKRIECDSFELLAALVNVMFNAIDALAERGGQVTVRTGSADKRVWFDVSDDGPGMPADVRARLFEPFFTTKPSGVGIGLAMVKACIDRHGGTIAVDSTSDRGTTFRIELPMA